MEDIVTGSTSMLLSFNSMHSYIQLKPKQNNYVCILWVAAQTHELRDVSLWLLTRLPTRTELFWWGSKFARTSTISIVEVQSGNPFPGELSPGPEVEEGKKKRGRGKEGLGFYTLCEHVTSFLFGKARSHAFCFHCTRECTYCGISKWCKCRICQ